MEWQLRSNLSESGKNERPTAAIKKYALAIYIALITQAAIGVLLIALFDDGRPIVTTRFAVLAFWIGVALIIWRRPKAPTPTDLWLIRFGFVPLMILSYVIARCVWSLVWIWKIQGISPG